MKRKLIVIIVSLLSGIITNTHAELVLVSGMAKQKNYIDTASIVIKKNPKVIFYNQLIFFDQNFVIQQYRNSVMVYKNMMNCDEKNWVTLSEVRKTTDQRKVLEVLQDNASSLNIKPVINSGPVKFIYDNYCR
ncbi:hypothetical protein [Acinetobacter venetianus]|uniref:hypothetical protein n=1 Tax=Acinetobacter venetianus TaxID=52133 RepID=UPI00289AE411|nr:hypothetical protein [Acinetobacter venetianus]